MVKVTIDTDDYLKIIKHEIMERMVGKTWNLEVQKMLDETMSGVRKDVENEDPNTIGEHLMQHAAKSGTEEFWGFLEPLVDLLGSANDEGR